MNIFDTSGITDDATDEITIASSSKSIEVMNMCHLALDVTGDTQGLMFTLQPFQSKAKVVNSGQTVQFKLHQPITQAIQNPNEYVQVNQSTEPTESAVQALAFVPVYTDNVQLTGTNSVAIASGSTVGINGTPTVQFAQGQQVGINGTANVQFPTAQAVTLASTGNVNLVGSTVTQDSNVINDYISTNANVLLGSVTVTISNLAPNASHGYINVTNLPAQGYYDALFIILQSSNGLVQSYSHLLNGLYANNTGSAGNFDVETTNQINTTHLGNDSAGGNHASTWYASFPSTMFYLVANQITNNSAQTIVSDTVSITVYGIKASITNFQAYQSQTQTTPFNIPSQTIPSLGTTAPVYTAPIPATNIKKVSVQLQQTTATGLLGATYANNSIALIARLEVSNDGTNFSSPQGYDTSVDEGAVNGWTHPFAIIPSYVNGANIVSADSSNVLSTLPCGIPAMAEGYPFIRFAVYIGNGGTSTPPVSASGNLIVNYLE